MARTIKVVYENGVFRPLEPVYLDEGTELEMYLPYEPGLADPVALEKALRELQEAAAELTDEEWAKIEADILGPRRLAARANKEKCP